MKKHPETDREKAEFAKELQRDLKQCRKALKALKGVKHIGMARDLILNWKSLAEGELEYYEKFL